jgi:AraC-like DNA-binding protein
VNRTIFSSDQLPSDLNDRARFNLWRDIYCAILGEAEVERQPDRTFSVRSESMEIGAVGLTRFKATLLRVMRSRRQLSADQRDDFLIGFNDGGRQLLIQGGREVVGPTAIFTNGEPLESRMDADCAVTGLRVPRAHILELVPGAEDLIARALSVGEASRHLARYIRFLLESDAPEPGGPLSRQIELTLIDLVALSLGASGEAQEIGRTRGLRAARLHAIFAAIRLGFADPAFSVHAVAAELGLTPHYVQNLLSETEASFSERVLDLRLRKARSMLTDSRNNGMKIGDIAYACGFNEVSYFNRCFRRRFGASPSQFRGTGSVG